MGRNSRNVVQRYMSIDGCDKCYIDDRGNDGDDNDMCHVIKINLSKYAISGICSDT